MDVANERRDVRRGGGGRLWDSLCRTRASLRSCWRRDLAAVSSLAALGARDRLSVVTDFSARFTHTRHASLGVDCEYPEGWEAKSGGKRGPVWAKFSSGPAKIHIKASATGSLASDAMGGSNADSQAPVPQMAPVHKIHVAAMEAAEQEYDDYTEIAGSPIVAKCVLGPARLSGFTATTSFGSALHGYRVTIIGHDKGINIFCVCLESDWNAVKPAFDSTLASLDRGVEQLR